MEKLCLQSPESAYTAFALSSHDWTDRERKLDTVGIGWSARYLVADLVLGIEDQS
jgi:hypothetical protein